MDKMKGALDSLRERRKQAHQMGAPEKVERQEPGRK